MSSTLKGKRKRPDTEIVSDTEIISDTESVGSNFQGKIYPPLELGRKMDLDLDLPEQFQNNHWPEWKDKYLITELILAQEKRGPYTNMAEKRKYGWKMSELWQTIATNVQSHAENRCRYPASCHREEHIWKTSVEQVKERTRLYKKHALMLYNSRSQNSSQDIFLRNLKQLFIGSDRAILGEVVVPNTPRSSNQVEVPNTRHSSGRSRGKSIAISSHHSGVTEVALPGASGSTFNPRSKYFKDAIDLSKNVEVALKEVFSTNRLPPADYNRVFNMLTQSDVRILSFLSYDENAKLRYVQYFLQNSSTQLPLCDTNNQLALENTQLVDYDP